jgi:hypothetical protein
MRPLKIVARNERKTDQRQSAPLTRFQTLIDQDARFRAAWDHDGYDPPCRECERVLVECAATAKWTEAEIAGLLAAHRSRYGQWDAGLAHKQNLIAKAREKQSRAQAIRELELLIAREPPTRDDDGKVPQEPRDAEAHRAAILRQINVVFGLAGEKEIVRVERFQCEPAEYCIYIAAKETDGPNKDKNKAIRLRGIRDLVEQKWLRWHIIDLTGEMIPAFDVGDWRIIAQALMDARIEVSAGEEATDIGLVKSWLDGYLTPDRVLDSFSEQERKGKEPFRQDGQVYFFLETFRRWIYINHGDRVKTGDLCILLRRAGAEPATPHVYQGGKRTSVRVWRAPVTTEEPTATATEGVATVATL